MLLLDQLPHSDSACRQFEQVTVSHLSRIQAGNAE